MIAKWAWKRGKGRKAWLSNREGTRRSYLFAATFLCPGSMVLPLSLNQGSGQPINKRSEVEGVIPMSLHPWVVVTVCFQPSPFTVTSGDGLCWGFFFFQPSLLRSCPGMHAKEHRKRRVSYFTTSGVAENRYGRKHCSELWCISMCTIAWQTETLEVSGCGRCRRDSPPAPPQEQGQDSKEIPSDSFFHQWFVVSRQNW